MQLVDKILLEVHSLLGQKNYELAVWILDKLLFDAPDNGKAHHERAVLAHQCGDIYTARAHFMKAASIDPGNPAFLKSLGDFYHVSEGNADLAIIQYEQALELQPGHLDTLLTIAHLCLSQRRFEEAVRYYKRFLNINPEHDEVRRIIDQIETREIEQQKPEISVPSLYEHARSLANKGMPQEAIKALKKVIEVDKGHANAHNDLAVLSYEMGDKEMAFRHYEQAVSLEPGNPIFQKNMADFLWVEKGDASGAMKVYIKVLKSDPKDIEALLGCGQICMAVGKADEARAFIDCILAIEPWNKEASHLLSALENSELSGDEFQATEDLRRKAEEMASNGDIHGAINALTSFLQLEPENSDMLNDLGVLYYEIGDKPRALEYYEKALKRSKDKINILKNVADFYFVEEERFEDALRLYSLALEKDPNDTETLLAIGLICRLLEKQEDAADFYRRVIEIEPWNEVAGKAISELTQSGAITGHDIRQAALM